MLDANIKRRVGLVILGLATGVFHLAVGAYYATHLSPRATRASLTAND